MKILNAYAGIGGNRKLWDGEKHDIVAVEWDSEIADIYRDHFPQDKVIEADAHEFIEENSEEFDFIWSSPPCPTHSRIRKIAKSVHGEGRQNEPIYPNMELYEEILFLKGYFEGNWVVENVVSWYDPLIKPEESNDHYFWSNFPIPTIELTPNRGHNDGVGALEELKGFNLSGYGLNKDKRQKLLRNAVHPKIGEAIFEARNRRQASLKEATI